MSETSLEGSQGRTARDVLIYGDAGEAVIDEDGKLDIGNDGRAEDKAGYTAKKIDFDWPDSEEEWEEALTWLMTFGAQMEGYLNTLRERGPAPRNLPLIAGPGNAFLEEAWYEAFGEYYGYDV